MKQHINQTIQFLICALYLVAVSGGLLWLAQKPRHVAIARSIPHSALWQRLQYQSILALCSGLIFGYGYVTHLPFAQWGNIMAQAQPNPFLGITLRDNWLTLWFGIGLIICATTIAFMWLSRARDQAVSMRAIIRYLPLIILLSGTNSFAEEIIYRLVPIWMLSGFEPMIAIAVSALAFGIVHYWGVPNGIIGVVMAAFLSYISTLSIFETGGILWAWGLHLVLDIIIFSQLIPRKD